MESLYLEDCPLFSELPYRFDISKMDLSPQDAIKKYDIPLETTPMDSD
jgi:hypothetical protein